MKRQARILRIWYYGRINLAKKMNNNKMFGISWRMSILDGEGNITTSWGIWENGERVEYHRETFEDIFRLYTLPRPKNSERFHFHNILNKEKTSNNER